MVRFKASAVIGSNILFVSLLTLILFATVGQATFADNGIRVNAVSDNKIVSFNVNPGNDSPLIHGLIVTIVDGHYSKVATTPAGWSAGLIKDDVVHWTTNNDPVEPGGTEDGFAIELRHTGEYLISWRVIDNEMQSIAWGTVTITVQ